MRRKAPLSYESEGEEPLINLTPLIDVVFVVLIAFILIAPILNVELVSLAQGGAASEKVAPTTRPLCISIKEDQSIWFKNKKTNLKDLKTLLETERKLAPNQIPQLAPDKNAPFGIYQEVKNLLETLGFEEMEIVLKP